MYIDKLKMTETLFMTETDLNELPSTAKINSKQTVEIDGHQGYLVNYTIYNTVIGYDKIVEGLIKDRYSIEQELCLTNKGIKDATNTEYVEYRNYVEQCKINARVFIEERYNALGK